MIEESIAKYPTDNIVKEVEVKLNSFQSNLETMKICITEKDSYIVALEEKIKEVEHKFETILNKQSERIDEQNNTG